MPVVKVEPTKDHQIPYDTTDEKPDSFLEDLAVAGNTAELQQALGASLDLETTPRDAEREKALFDAVLQKKQTKNLRQPQIALAAASFLRTYSSGVALDAVATRSAVTNKLMEIANCGDARYELKALELLGKHSDIGLFTDRSEITINYKNPDDLENAIKERVKRLLNADVIDVTPLGANLDEELGVAESKVDDELDEWLDVKDDETEGQEDSGGFDEEDGGEDS